jgi:hypothetical protein
MMDLEGSIRPAMYLARELVARGHKVSMMSPAMSHDVEDSLKAQGVTPINLHAKLAAKNTGLSMLWFETWIREAFLRLNSRHVANEPSTTINFSQVIALPSLVWYLQGPPSRALKDMEKELSTSFRITYDVLKPMIKFADGRLASRMASVSAFVIANSKFCASMYSTLGVHARDVIYPPIDCQVFCPSASKASVNYVLAYFGKETKFSVIEKVADSGVKIKAFGSKTPFVPRSLMTHPNIEFLGRVGIRELVELYSNALFTLFPFTHEPFGYVPIESNACGTPALTYDVQGPGEYVINGVTGWLAHTDNDLVLKSAELWERGYPSHMRKACIDEAYKFDKKFYLEKWLDLLSCLADNRLTVRAELSPELLQSRIA